MRERETGDEYIFSSVTLIQIINHHHYTTRTTSSMVRVNLIILTPPQTLLNLSLSFFLLLLSLSLSHSPSQSIWPPPLLSSLYIPSLNEKVSQPASARAVATDEEISRRAATA